MITLKASGRYCTKITLESPNPRETSERMNFNVIDKKQLT
jgi:hypothetical protein